MCSWAARHVFFPGLPFPSVGPAKWEDNRRKQILQGSIIILNRWVKWINILYFRFWKAWTGGKSITVFSFMLKMWVLVVTPAWGRLKPWRDAQILLRNFVRQDSSPWPLWGGVGVGGSLLSEKPQSCGQWRGKVIPVVGKVCGAPGPGEMECCVKPLRAP